MALTPAQADGMSWLRAPRSAVGGERARHEDPLRSVNGATATPGDAQTGLIRRRLRHYQETAMDHRLHRGRARADRASTKTVSAPLRAPDHNPTRSADQPTTNFAIRLVHRMVRHRRSNVSARVRISCTWLLRTQHGTRRHLGGTHPVEANDTDLTPKRGKNYARYSHCDGGDSCLSSGLDRPHNHFGQRR